MKRLVLALCMAALLAPVQSAAFGQTPDKGTVERIKVHGKGLEGNLEGDSPDRVVSVYLPPTYQTATRQRYPVIYMLHGFTDSDEQWMGFKKHWINLPEVIDRAIAKKESREMIVVMPNAFTRYAGSMYSNSVTTGNWEDYVAKELVAYVDSHYRTLASAATRGLAGHSMGGYGAARIGMKYPETFSSVYLLSPCCMTPNLPTGGRGPTRAEEVRTDEDFAKSDFGTKAQIASAAAWSPNPANPPMFFDLPTRNGELQMNIALKLAANATLGMIDQYITNIRKLKAFAFDAGAQDEPIAGTVRTLHQMMTDYAIAHEFEIYEGNHLNHVADRIETRTLPFFTKNLKAAVH